AWPGGAAESGVVAQASAPRAVTPGLAPGVRVQPALVMLVSVPRALAAWWSATPAASPDQEQSASPEEPKPELWEVPRVVASRSRPSAQLRACSPGPERPARPPGSRRRQLGARPAACYRTLGRARPERRRPQLLRGSRSSPFPPPSAPGSRAVFQHA